MSKGFTMIEVIVVTALTGVMILVLAQFFFSTQSIYRLNGVDLNVNFDARVALDDIDLNVRQSNSLLDSYDIYTASSTLLILEMPSVSSLNQIVPGSYDHVIYSLSGNSLTKQVIPDPASVRPAVTRQLASHVQSLTFSIPGNGAWASASMLNTSLMLTDAEGRESKTITISSQSHLRN